MPCEHPAPVAPLPPRRVPKSVTFSMVRSVIFSMVIDRIHRRANLTAYRRLYSGACIPIAARSHVPRQALSLSSRTTYRITIRSRIRAAASSTASRNAGLLASFLSPVDFAAILFASVEASNDVVRCLPLWWWWVWCSIPLAETRCLANPHDAVALREHVEARGVGNPLAVARGYRLRFRQSLRNPPRS